MESLRKEFILEGAEFYSQIVADYDSLIVKLKEQVKKASVAKKPGFETLLQIARQERLICRKELKKRLESR